MSGRERYGNWQKYTNPNPLQRFLMRRFLEQAAAWIAPLDIHRVLDAGCAEGFVTRFLLERGALPADAFLVGVDLDREAMERGTEVSPQMRKFPANITALPFADASFDLVMATEILEHLPDPRRGLREVKRVSRRYCLLSVPHEPWFRAMNFLRGKHLHRWGNDPEHLQNWSLSAFRRFVAGECRVLAVRSVLPWTLLLAVKE